MPSGEAFLFLLVKPSFSSLFEHFGDINSPGCSVIHLSVHSTAHHFIYAFVPSFTYLMLVSLKKKEYLLEEHRGPKYKLRLKQLDFSKDWSHQLVKQEKPGCLYVFHPPPPGGHRATHLCFSVHLTRNSRILNLLVSLYFHCHDPSLK